MSTIRCCTRCRASSTASSRRASSPWAWPRARWASATAWCPWTSGHQRSEEHTSELQSRENLVCRLLLEKKNMKEKQDAALLAVLVLHRHRPPALLSGDVLISW